MSWTHGSDVACVERDGCRYLLNLERLEQPPVILEGSALLIHDSVNGERDTEDIVALLSDQFPEVGGLADQVRECLQQLAHTGLIKKST